MAYFTQDDLSALIPEGWLTEGLDDNSDGTQDAFTKVQRLAEARVNGVLGQRYAVPFAPGNAGLDAFLLDVASHVAARLVYQRRGLLDKFPFAADFEILWSRLGRIASGEDPLSPVIEQVNDTVAVISEPSRVYSKSAGH
ncbi:phage protein Gp36 family protein [Prosthecobacter dejongeii]|uniref:Phage gp36-like protein n=1 Tax=Prosthecobacter dejongeii TaxID=48465 RepID=A0A7W8DPA1_9BACT|nr:phage protein Gp36 family protein [Prosthecobacter dejongeii]MBB5037112.1 phage gp36-like protein [Prosthecobacter dejongeii]